ncbi:MAG: dihydrolipoyl dehydrogenase [Candidatus Muproteobacteria bacterium RIFCSPHIGHO2_12_FULL_60_33]|uniref:Dihydrolipoyl dehydrogenase n=1 Tax=Candidatus Muproteobacteria bacterium RIFCSPLOWO2_01_FULL_60_18 TaxID=1817768 RepID=A0A1F6U166_9PROT|nr:MAG: dihydrolipoyl dehydrogenase [Candidatus Muproteobacteria bacterium RIFCSPHIGHO2_01_60_12]OGI51069.1 MAG: dihydrolipoyl dehydrogenase [Candidatus Muproteobacteria bacterium RIFCSPLOWO2_01_FULL_60_18]OGI54629.1 MAG: dihydrolipoyl dehydrogenase [Candidatus Muproteobacteria bacterium RIFCSPHIGHO2_02_FULL_60_13]OGI56141.1 MAG: dihydrolipoyl dehydrogenase [Candidatus Muproteobacteria bacterium RIFCSPHIGHO2_12_FULL_60_33]OGI58855.1 MAG: dihydrolipoyl dehydrogenase [Candidatus Muproteobacteria 
MAERYDLVVIGAGPAGYTAAIRAAQLGLKVACVDDWRGPAGEPALGGTCLNAGCIPSKALLETSEFFAQARDHGPARGLKFKELALDLAAMLAHKNKVVSDLTRGIATLFKAHGVTWIPGRGKLLPKNQVEVSGQSPQQLEAEHVILASGSTPVGLKSAPFDGQRVVDSQAALEFQEVPRRLGIIGAGVIGLELGSVWRRLGAEVVLLEAQETFLPMADEQVAREALKQFTAQGLDIRLGARVLGSKVENSAVAVRYQEKCTRDGAVTEPRMHKDGARTESVDRLIVAVGRRPNTDGLVAEETRLLQDEWGFVHVDEHCRTNLPNVYAVGDLVRGPMLAHKGMEEGVMVAERIAGRETAVNYDVVPSVIYTQPEIAWVGKTEQALKAAGVAYRAGVFPFAANGRARAMGRAAGFIKILADTHTDRVLGVHLIGPNCSELVATAALAMSFNASNEDIMLTMFAHPTLSEAFHESALAVAGRAIHLAQPRRAKP